MLSLFFPSSPPILLCDHQRPVPAVISLQQYFTPAGVLKFYYKDICCFLFPRVSLFYSVKMYANEAVVFYSTDITYRGIGRGTNLSSLRHINHSRRGLGTSGPLVSGRSWHFGV